MSRRVRLLLVALAALVALPAIAYVAGPVYRIDGRVAAPSLPGPAMLDAWLSTSEARFPDIVPGAGKSIVWAHADRRRTTLAVIYLHGYTATRQEVAPLCDRLAAALGANLFYTRLAGHGRAPAAMGEASAEDWLRDAAEALAVGRVLGERVIVVGTSTGGTLALWLAQRPEAVDIAAQVLVSPNLGPRDERSTLLAGPWGYQLQRLLIGEEYRWQPANERQAKYWTWKYPARALVPMMALVKSVRSSPLEGIRTPTLVIHSPKDAVVSPARIEEAYARLGSPMKRIVKVEDSEDRAHHVLAGDILAPAGTEALLAAMLDFLRDASPAESPATTKAAAASGQAPGANGLSAVR
jgi:esterase/lipase